jgi:hypothetical protein
MRLYIPPSDLVRLRDYVANGFMSVTFGEQVYSADPQSFVPAAESSSFNIAGNPPILVGAAAGAAVLVALVVILVVRRRRQNRVTANAGVVVHLKRSSQTDARRRDSLGGHKNSSSSLTPAMDASKPPPTLPRPPSFSSIAGVGPGQDMLQQAKFQAKKNFFNKERDRENPVFSSNHDDPENGLRAKARAAVTLVDAEIDDEVKICKDGKLLAAYAPLRGESPTPSETEFGFDSTINDTIEPSRPTFRMPAIYQYQDPTMLLGLPGAVSTDGPENFGFNESAPMSPMSPLSKMFVAFPFRFFLERGSNVVFGAGPSFRHRRRICTTRHPRATWM